MKQRRNECLLASVCAVTGTDYLTASDLYREIYAKPWGDIDRINWCEFLDNYVIPGWAMLRDYFDGKHSVVSLEGTGVVILYCRISGHRHAHAVAYADGLVWDPAHDTYHATMEDCIQSIECNWYVYSVHRKPSKVA